MSAFEITAGFMPLLDSALIVVAKAKGFAEEEGVALKLVRETSWANIRDRLAVGHSHVAQSAWGPCTPIAGNLGLTPLPSRTIAPMALGLGGNAVTVSNTLWEKMRSHGARETLHAAANGAALAAAIRANPDARPRFAVVHPYSGHSYELRYWLAASGVDPERDIEIVILPPPFMPEALANGGLDGYCVGEPWNTAAVAEGVGHIATAKAAIGGRARRKCSACRSAGPRRTRRLWRRCSAPSIAPRSGRPIRPIARRSPRSWRTGPCRPAGRVEEAGAGRRIRVSATTTVRVEDFFVPLARGATFPWKSHALWFYTQMVRWGQVTHTAENEAVARETYRPDLYRAALKPLGVRLPAANSKVEGALKAPTPVGASGATLTLGPDGFFDGGLFDPDRVAEYIHGRSR